MNNDENNIPYDCLPIENVDEFPYTVEIPLGNFSYLFTFIWNPIDRQFLINIDQMDETPIYHGEVLHLNQPLWRGINVPNLPFESIIPYDISGKETDINPDNLGNTVQLIIDDLDGD